MQDNKMFLIGDNPFHNISHLSQDRTRRRDPSIDVPDYAADLILASVDNGANGFMFTVSETTLSILKTLKQRDEIKRIRLYAIVPYAYEYVKLSTQVGGIPGLAKKVGKEMIFSGKMGSLGTSLVGLAKSDPARILRSYLSYELNRIKSSAGRGANLDSIILHEVVTDLALGLQLDWLFNTYIEFLEKENISPGFNTINFTQLVTKLKTIKSDVSNLTIVSPFNKIGFQMAPSREENEKTLRSLTKPVLIAISILACGYLSLPEAVDYIGSLANIKGVAVGISKKEQARQTFLCLREKLSNME